MWCLSERLQKSNRSSKVVIANTRWRDIASWAIQSDKLPLLQNLPWKKCKFLNPDWTLHKFLGCNSVIWHWELWEATLLERCCLLEDTLVRRFSKTHSSEEATDSSHSCTYACQVELNDIWLGITKICLGRFSQRGGFALIWFQREDVGCASDTRVEFQNVAPARREALVPEWRLTWHQRHKWSLVSDTRGKS